MLTEGNFRLTGLKETDISPEIHKIIDEAEEYLIICGYSFTSHTNPKSILKRVIDSSVPNKHCILPISLFRGKDTNRQRAINLIKNNISVSLENKNHSKWIMSEKEIYYGSANFSIDSLEKKIEVATFRLFSQGDLMRKEFTEFTLSSISRMLTHSDRRKLRGVLNQNNNLSRDCRILIRRLNPSIEKVFSTLDSIDYVRSLLLDILGNSFFHLNDHHYMELTNEAQKDLNLLNSINFNGRQIINSYETRKEYSLYKKYYNYNCDNFDNKILYLTDLSKDFLSSKNIVPKFAKRNRNIANGNILAIKKYIS